MAKEKETTIDQLIGEINEEFARWDHIREHGCSDPLWPDGVNINLVRNHIIYSYQKILDLLSGEETQMSMFAPDVSSLNLRPVPERMSDNWICPTGDHPDRPNMTFVHDWGTVPAMDIETLIASKRA